MAHEKVMVVEDERIIAWDIEERLKRLGYEVCAVVSTGEEAITKAADTQPDLVLMDVMLKGKMDGIEAAAEIYRLLNIPVVYLTAYADDSTFERAKITAPFGYILKPFEEREVNIAIEVALYKQQMTRKLKESEAYHRALIENAPDAISLLSSEGVILYTSPSTTRLLGYTSEEMVGRDIFSLIHPDDAPKMRNLFARLRQKPCTMATDQFRRRHKDGSWRWLEGTLTNLYAEPSVRAIVSNFRDITERKLAEQALQESENKLRTITYSVQDGIVLLDQEGAVAFWNPAAEKIFGYTQREAMGRDLHLLLVPSQYHDAYRKALARFWQTGEGNWIGNTLELEVVRKDGARITIELSLSALQLGGTWHTVGIVRDITERQRAQETLRKSQSMLAEAQQIAHLGNWEWDIASDELTWSDETCRILGYAPGEVVPRLEVLQNAVHPADRGVVDQAIADALNNEKPYSLDHRVIRKNGVVANVHSQAEVKFDSSGKPVKMVGIMLDITERKLAEQALTEERNLLRTLIDNLPDSIYVKDTELRFVMINPAHRALLGVSAPDAAIGKTDFDFFPQEQAAGFFADEQAIIQTGQPLLNREEVAKDNTTGRLIRIQTTKVPLRNDQGTIIGLIGISHDITDRIRAQQELFTAELLRVELAKDKELLDLKERFISMVSHEYRTPLAVILSSGQILERYFEQLAPEQRLKYLRQIRAQIRYMVELLDDVLLFDKAQAGKLKFRAAPLDLEAFCSDLLAQMRLTDTKHHVLTLNVEGRFDQARLDETLLRHILFNLLSNAIKYSPDGGEIQFNLSLEGQDIVFQISDQGIGIPIEDQKRLFEPFHRSVNVQDIQGTGLGLSIVKSSVEAHGGTVAFKSEPGKGTMFTVRLPVAVEQPPRSHARKENASP